MRFTTFAIAALATCAIALPTKDVTASASVSGSVSVSASSSFDLFGGLSAEGCAAFAGACFGAKASDISASARASLEAWIGGDVDLDADLKSSLKSWCSGSAELGADIIAELSVYVPVAVGIAAQGGLSVDVTGISTVSAAVGIAIEASLQADISAFLEVNLDIDSEVNVALHVCANGGVVAALTADVKAALIAYLGSSDCGLSAELKAAIGLWVNDKTGAGVSVLTNVSSAASVSASVGVALAAAVDVEGCVSASYISALKAWLDVQVDLDADIKAALELCIEAKAAISLEVDVVAKLTAWLLSDKCGLASELKAVILVWLHIRATVSDAVSVLSSVDIATLTAWFESGACDSLSAAVKAVIAVAIAGEAVVNVSVDVIAELVSVITGLVADVSISVDIVVILGKWISGNTCGCN